MNSCCVVAGQEIEEPPSELRSRLPFWSVRSCPGGQGDQFSTQQYSASLAATCRLQTSTHTDNPPLSANCPSFTNDFRRIPCRRLLLWWTVVSLQSDNKYCQDLFVWRLQSTPSKAGLSRLEAASGVFKVGWLWFPAWAQPL